MKPDLYNESDINVLFKENEFFPLIRQRKFTEIDFFSYTGGTLGETIFSSRVKWGRMACKTIFQH